MSFRIGFTGATLDVVLPWLQRQVGEAPHVVVPMAGSGKDLAALARPGRTLRSWDPQYLSACVVQGVLAANGPLPSPIARTAWVGYAVQHGGIRHLPPEAACLADAIAAHGTDYDRACLAKALIRCTYLGRLGTWTRTATEDTLWVGYLRAHRRLAPWRGQPGAFVHTHGSVFDDPALAHDLTGATVVIDTPKVLTARANGGDIYSQGFVGLNSILAQAPQTLPAWTEATFRRDMPRLLQGAWTKLILFHASGCLPTPDALEQLLYEWGLMGHLQDYQEWTHKGRTDMAWVFTR